MRIYVVPTGQKVTNPGTDITEGVQTLYDLVVQSMDWGSGFISVEDAIPVAQLARACNFNGIEECERYIEQKREMERLDQLRRAGVTFQAAAAAAKEPALTEYLLKTAELGKLPPAPPQAPRTASVGQLFTAVTTNPDLERIEIEREEEGSDE